MMKGWKRTMLALAVSTVVLLPAALARADGNPKFDLQDIPAGYRGVSIPIPGHQLLFVNKGDRIDLLTTFEANMKDAKEKVTATILQNVIVAEVYKPGDPEKMGVIELICNPNEAQYTALGQLQGAFHISVRPRGETKMEPMEMASYRKLFK